MGVCSSQLPLAISELRHARLIGAGVRGSVWPRQGVLRPGGVGGELRNGAKTKGGRYTTVLAKGPRGISLPACGTEGLFQS